MSQAAAIIESLKGALRQRNLTYAELGRRLGLSESAIKRMFAQRNLSLERLEDICALIGLGTLPTGK